MAERLMVASLAASGLGQRLRCVLAPAAAGLAVVVLAAGEAKALVVYGIQGSSVPPGTVLSGTFELVSATQLGTFSINYGAINFNSGTSSRSVVGGQDFRFQEGQNSLRFSTLVPLSFTSPGTTTTISDGIYCSNQPGNSGQNNSPNNSPCPANATVTISGTITPVPAPLSALALGPLGLLLAARRRYRQQPAAPPGREHCR